MHCRERPVRLTALKAILVARSPVFEKMFCGPLAESQDVIAVTDMEPPAFQELLRYWPRSKRESGRFNNLPYSTGTLFTRKVLSTEM
jgi:hypothetical protein